MNRTDTAPLLHAHGPGHSHFHGEQVVVLIGVVIFMLVSVIGNVLVLLSYRRDTRLQEVHNLYLVHMAVCDLLISTVMIPRCLVFIALHIQWVIPVICKLTVVIDLVLNTMAPLLVLLVGIDRLALINLGVRYNSVETKERATLKLVCCWSLATAFYTPLVLYVLEDSHDHDHHVECFLEFSEVMLVLVVMRACSVALPVLLLAVVNFLLWRAIQRRFQLMARVFTSSPPPGITPAALLQQEKMKMKESRQQHSVFTGGSQSSSMEDEEGWRWCCRKNPPQIPADLRRRTLSILTYLRKKSSSIQSDVSRADERSTKATLSSLDSASSSYRTSTSTSTDSRRPARRWWCCQREGGVVEASSRPVARRTSGSTSPILRIGDPVGGRSCRVSVDMELKSLSQESETSDMMEQKHGHESPADHAEDVVQTETAADPPSPDNRSPSPRPSEQEDEVHPLADLSPLVKVKRRVTFSDVVDTVQSTSQQGLVAMEQKDLKPKNGGAEGDVAGDERQSTLSYTAARIRHLLNHPANNLDDNPSSDWSERELTLARVRYRLIQQRCSETYYHFHHMHLQERRRQRQLRRLYTRKSRVERLLVVLVLALLVTWFPYSLVSILVTAGVIDEDEVSVYVIFFLLWFKSCVNPYLYAYNSPRFRKNFSQLLKPLTRRCVCIRRCMGLCRRKDRGSANLLV